MARFSQVQPLMREKIVQPSYPYGSATVELQTCANQGKPRSRGTPSRRFLLTKYGTVPYGYLTSTYIEAEFVTKVRRSYSYVPLYGAVHPPEA